MRLFFQLGGVLLCPLLFIIISPLLAIVYGGFGLIRYMENRPPAFSRRRNTQPAHHFSVGASLKKPAVLLGRLVRLHG